MSKIVQAANSMITNSHRISNVIKGHRDLFFLYSDKYKWSIWFDEDEDNYFLFYYPDGLDLEQLASLEPFEWDDVPIVIYKTSDLGTKEAHATFAELYSLVQQKLYGMDDVLEDIISDDSPN